jgi:sec-independent protein translocase protein TatC
MSFAGVIGLFRADPRHRVGAGGQMALSDHLRELRARLLRVVTVLILGLIAALLLHSQIFDLIYHPYLLAQEQLKHKVKTEAVINGAAGPMLLQLKLCGVAAVVFTSPYWLYQIWAFIVPGLHPQERRWSRLFAAVAGPLFLAGVSVGYYVLPKGLEVLIGFAGDKLLSLVDFGEYFSFFSRMLLIFGIAFEIPLFVVLLNLAGVVSGRALGNHRPWIVVGTFVFAAVATPSTDPFSMLMLALPMVVLFMISEVIARFVDKRRGLRADDDLDDDQASDLDHQPDRIRRSDLSEDED